MKKFIYLLILFIGFSGCSVDSLDSEDQINSYDAKAQQDDGVSLSYDSPVCEGAVTTFCISFPQAYKGNGEAKETRAQFQYYDEATGEYVQIHNGSGNTESCFEYTFNEAKTYDIRYKAGDQFNDDEIVVEDCSNCDNLLVAELTCGDTSILEVSFVAEESGPIVIQGGLTSGTNIIDAQSEALEQNLTHPGVVNSNANVTRWEGDVTACEEVTITIEFTGGNGIGDWTAKRNDIELTDPTPEQTCD